MTIPRHNRASTKGRVNGIPRSDAMATRPETPPTPTSLYEYPLSSHTIQLFVLYHPLFTNTSTSYLHPRSSSPRCTNVFKATPFVAFRRTNNLSDLLVSAKLRNPTQNNPPHGSFRCQWRQLFNLQLHNRRTYKLHISFYRRNKTYYSSYRL